MSDVLIALPDYVVYGAELAADSQFAASGDKYLPMLGWRSLAREKQLPPPGDWFVWFIGSGRGFGKTWTGSNWTIEKAATYPGCTIALIGQTAGDVRKTMIEINPSSIMKQSPPDFRPIYEPSKRQLTWPNGTIGLIYYGDEPDQLRGPQPDFAWVDELAKFKYPQEMWDMLEYGMRSGENPQVLVTTTPRPIPLIKMLVADPATVYVGGSTYENAANLSPKFLKRIRTKYEGTRLGRQELLGIILDDAPGALWKREEIETHRATKLPNFVRIVVAIDPAATSNEDSNQTGIVVAAIGEDKHGYVFEGTGMRVLPNVWAANAIAQYHKYKADRVIGETNNGGDMIETVIRAIDPTVSYKKVHASRGKVTRAEPVAALYDQGRVHHVGNLPEREDQLCSWEQGMDSPDLLDANVWALTELMLEEDRTIHQEPAPSFISDWRR